MVTITQTLHVAVHDWRHQSKCIHGSHHALQHEYITQLNCPALFFSVCFYLAIVLLGLYNYKEVHC